MLILSSLTGKLGGMGHETHPSCRYWTPKRLYAEEKFGTQLENAGDALKILTAKKFA
jgi:hypothetical protein